ncbi:hypothetical protein ACS0TY_035377 [Phlomoides rotata]
MCPPSPSNPRAVTRPMCQTDKSRPSLTSTPSLAAFSTPLVPTIRVFKSFPFNEFLVFLTLYFVVVRNQDFSKYVRFNTMQAIVLDVLLIFPDLLERTFNPRDGVGLDLLMSLESTMFLFRLVSLIYGCSSCTLCFG